jgi:predicted esterase
MADRVNVLCLHGCNQTQEMFEGLMKNYVRLGEKQYGLKFHFIEAKHNHPQGGKTWYNKPLDVSQIGQIQYDPELVNDTLDDIAKEIDEKQINVLLGFSQGANVVDTFLQYREHPNIKCAVIMSGYSLVDPNRKETELPILTVTSESDEIVSHKLSPTDYTEINFLRHDKGHKLPTSNAHIRQICSFMQA